MKRLTIYNFISNISFLGIFLSFWFEDILAVFMTSLGIFLFCLIASYEIQKKEKK